MNEEQEEEEQSLASLPEDILHERGERVYENARIVDGHQVVVDEMARQQILKNLVSGLDSKSPSYDRDVQSIFDVRPVNAVDTLFNGIIPLRVGGVAVCALSPPVPSGPFDKTFLKATIQANDFDVITNQQINGCTLWKANTDQFTTLQEVSVEVFDPSGTTTGTYNAYFYLDNVLVNSNLGFSITAASPNILAFSATDSAFWHVVITGATSSDISSNTVSVRMAYDVG